MEELYSHDKYNGFRINVVYNNGHYFGLGYLNGTCLIENVKSNSGERCLEKVKNEVDKIIHYEVKG